MLLLRKSWYFPAILPASLMRRMSSNIMGSLRKVSLKKLAAVRQGEGPRANTVGEACPPRHKVEQQSQIDHGEEIERGDQRVGKVAYKHGRAVVHTGEPKGEHAQTDRRKCQEHKRQGAGLAAWILFFFSCTLLRFYSGIRKNGLSHRRGNPFCRRLLLHRPISGLR